MITKTLCKVLIIFSVFFCDYTLSQDKYGISNKFHQKNRDDLKNQMPENSVSILFSSPIRNRSNDVNYHYHPDPNFYYLTGWKEPHSVLMIFKNTLNDSLGNYNEILFVRDRDPFDAVWFLLMKNGMEKERE